MSPVSRYRCKAQKNVDSDISSARTNYEVARCCEVLVDNDVNIWRAKEELSVRVMV